MLASYSTQIRPPDLADLAIGEILVNHTTKKAYVKDPHNRLIECREGISKLVDCIEFLRTKDTLTYDNSLLRYSSDQQLTTNLLLLELKDLEGVTLENRSTLLNYLGFDGNVFLTNLSKATFSISTLNDVIENLTLNPNVDGYKIAFVYTENLQNPQNDKFYKPSYGYFRLLPEASNLKDYLDVLYEVEEPISKIYMSRVITSEERNATRGKLAGKRIEVLPFSIEIDQSPTLGGSLDAKGYSLTNLNRTTTYITLPASQVTLTLEVVSNSVFIVNNPNKVCNSLNINFNFSNLQSNIVVELAIELDNFDGLISFPNLTEDVKILYENGKAPVLTGLTTILCASLYRSNDLYTVIIRQKANNLLSL